MIDTDKYEGHTPVDEWRKVFYHKLRFFNKQNNIEGLNIEVYRLGQWQDCDPESYSIAKANQDLVKDAPLILEDYKRLREAIVDIANNMEAADPTYLQGFIRDLLEVIE